jgi:hypothetical protein
MEYSFSSFISPRSLSSSSSKTFEFETQGAKDYVETLEQNLFNHTNLLKSLTSKLQSETCHSEIDPELKSPATIESLLNDINLLYSELRTVENERKDFMSKTLINELLDHEFKERQKEIESEYEEKLQETRFHIDRKDKLIYDLQRSFSELEMQSAYKSTNEQLMIVSLNKDVLSTHTAAEDLREMITDVSEKLNFGYNYKEFLIQYYKDCWRKSQIVQALLRNPVNIVEGSGRYIRLKLSSEEPDVTIEFEDSEIESGHIRAFTMEEDSFGLGNKNRNTLSSGKELIMAVKSKLVAKIEKIEKKLAIMQIEMQKQTDKLVEIGEKNFRLIQENSKLTEKYKDENYENKRN